MAAQLLPCVDHDPRYPLRRADAREHEAGRHFEQGVAEKEQAATKTVDRGAELQDRRSSEAKQSIRLRSLVHPVSWLLDWQSVVRAARLTSVDDGGVNDVRSSDGHSPSRAQ